MDRRQTVTYKIAIFMFLWNIVLAIAFTGFIIRYKLMSQVYFPAWEDFLNLSNVSNFVTDMWGVIVLSTIWVAVYTAMSFEAKSLRRMSYTLFSYQNTPNDWHCVKGQALFRLNGVFYVVLLLAMVWFLDNIAAFCGVFALLNIAAIIKIAKLRESAKYYFDRYPPLNGDRHKAHILERRRIVIDYLTNKPNAIIALLLTMLCVVTAIVSLLPDWGIPIFKGVPYLILATGMALHEYVVWGWWLARNRKLAEIDMHETQSDARQERKQLQAPDQWDELAIGTDADAWQEYLSRWPRGKLAEEARARLALIQAMAIDVEELFDRYKEQGFDPPTSKGDSVSCSVFAPSTMRSLSYALIQVFLHRTGEHTIAATLATQTDPNRGRQVTRDLDLPLSCGDEVEILIEPCGLELFESTPRIQTLIWCGKPENIGFVVKAPWSLFGRELLPIIRVSVGGKLIGRILFKLRVGIFVWITESSFVGEARHYKKAFLSYSSVDREEVLKRAQAFKLAGIEFFQDILHLEPGTRWSERLCEEIESADVFFLFWSVAAKRSKWVMREARFALSRQAASPTRSPDIVPVILDVPPPTPPQFLKHIHFNDPTSLVIAFYGANRGSKNERRSADSTDGSSAI